MQVSWKQSKEYLMIKNHNLQLSEICQKMPVKSFGQNTCIKKLQVQLLNSLKMLFTLHRSKNITETTTPWVKC